MRRLWLGGALLATVASLTACGGSSASSESARELRRQADLYAIDQIEKKWHRATSTQDLDLMMSLWAPNATYTRGPGQTLTGKEEIRRFWRDSRVFQPENHWVSDTPAYKIRITVNGNKGTLYFECHYIDPKTHKVIRFVGADQQVAKVNGRWLITTHVGATATMNP